ncbi:hypothetical protein [Mycobacterium sp. SMC-4]|uniref:hypothetical protein n=1 Tax=Mycobacterium sp. SMC-4 TaxID=2857059 RepID=UPI0021B3FE2B|nr:hypothetical protein [Mycobacterium sp. SMC-4]UXA17727.1 hypothetical protein KXD98_24000 [Mycobacterium sp. SMC-4]
MAEKNDKSKGAPNAEAESVTLKPEQYRSMILAKLRADIAAKKALYAAADNASLEELSNMSYWKMQYYKMHYWKAHHVKMADPE